MANIADIDKNFKVESTVGKEDIVYYDVRKTPFSVHGVFYENGQFRRMPEAVAKAVSPGVEILHKHTAGGRVRFRTDSPYIAIFVTLPQVGKMAHFPYTGSIGLDLYVREAGDETFVHTFVPTVGIADRLEGVYGCAGGVMREYTLNMPLYSAVSELFIGLKDTAKVEAPAPYTHTVPVVYYGSSVTQGACASRAGACYESIISRRLHTEYVNLGFSGSAKGEDAMIDYLASLEMSVFVCDYDYNAPHSAHLAATHEKLFSAVRATHPETPVIFMTRPRWFLSEDEEKCRQVVHTTYENAKAAGDTNVYLIDRSELLALCGCEGTVEGVHPNDFGFRSMAKAVGDVLEKLL